MSVAEIIDEVPNLSIEELKSVAQALREAAEDLEDLPDVLAVLNSPSVPIPMDEIRKMCGL
jgi:hypothetical protein